MGSHLVEALGHVRRWLRALRKRREAQVIAAYVASAWLVLEVISLLSDTFGLSAAWVRGAAVFFAVGLVLSLPVARWYALVARELERVGGLQPDDIPAVPDVVEAWLARMHRRVSGRTVWMAIALSLLLFMGGSTVLWGEWSRRQLESLDPALASLAVMVFDGRGPDADRYGEGLADMLSVLLDGTPGVQVVGGAPRRSTPLLAGPVSLAGDGDIDAARRAGARHAIFGRVMVSGQTLDVTAQLVTTADGKAVTTLRETAPADSLGRVAHRIALGLLPVVWRRDAVPTVPELDRLATHDVEALKAYLEAKRLQRRGLMSEAEEAIERAIAIDSTFALAHVARFSIRSWLLYQDAQPGVGLSEIIDRALRHADRLSPRNRLRIHAARAQNDTDGQRAAFLAERVLALDSLDADALETLAFTYLRDGWQIERGVRDVAAIYDRLIRVDSTSLVAHTFRAQVAMWLGEEERMRGFVRRVAREDSTGVYPRSTAAAIELLLAPEGEVPDRVRVIAEAGANIGIGVIRQVRMVRPDLAEALMESMTREGLPVFTNRVGEGARLQLWLGQGRLSAVSAAIESRRFEGLRPVLQRGLIAAQLAGVGDPVLGRAAARELARYAPVDSLGHYLEQRMVWQSAWAVSAWEATFGDTVQARRWQHSIAALPQGDTRWDWTGSLAADIEGRIAMRRADLVEAERAAARAFRLWMIHAADAFEGDPEPAMRFQLAEIHRARGDDAAAEPYYRALLPPHTWMGFLSLRSAYELARIEAGRGNAEEALRYLDVALRHWERGDPAVVGSWREDAERERARLARSL